MSKRLLVAAVTGVITLLASVMPASAGDFYGGYRYTPEGQQVPSACVNIGTLIFTESIPYRHSIAAANECAGSDQNVSVYQAEFDPNGNIVNYVCLYEHP